MCGPFKAGVSTLWLLWAPLGHTANTLTLMIADALRKRVCASRLSCSKKVHECALGHVQSRAGLRASPRLLAGRAELKTAPGLPGVPCSAQARVAPQADCPAVSL